MYQNKCSIWKFRGSAIQKLLRGAREDNWKPETASLHQYSIVWNDQSTFNGYEKWPCSSLRMNNNIRGGAHVSYENTRRPSINKRIGTCKTRELRKRKQCGRKISSLLFIISTEWWNQEKQKKNLWINSVS